MKKALAVAVLLLSACSSVQQMGDRDLLTNEVRKAVGVHQVQQNAGAIALKVDAITITGTEAEVTWTESQASAVVQSKQHYTKSPAGQWLPSGEAVEVSRTAPVKTAAKR
jgi:hypothetical protein